MRLEQFAHERWTAYDKRGDLGDGGAPYSDDAYRKDVLKAAAPEMLALLLDWRDSLTPGNWRDKRDALITRLRREVENTQ